MAMCYMAPAVSAGGKPASMICLYRCGLESADVQSALACRVVSPELARWIFSIVFIVAGAASLLQSVGRLRLSRLFRDLATSRVRSAAQGLVEIRGRAGASPLGPLLSPFSHTPCCWYRAAGGCADDAAVERESVAPFVVDDGTGQCLVWPAGAEISAARARVWRTDDPDPKLPLDPADAEVVTLMSLVSRWPRARRGGGVFHEILIEPGEVYHLVGSFHTVERRATLERLARVPALCAWAEGGGSASALPAKWRPLVDHVLQLRRRLALARGFAGRLQRFAADRQTLALLQRDGVLPRHQLSATPGGPWKTPFIISNSRQDHLASYYRRGAVAGVWFSLAMVLVGLAVAIHGFIG